MTTLRTIRTLDEIAQAIDEMKTRGAWATGVKAYAQMIIKEIAEATATGTFYTVAYNFKGHYLNEAGEAAEVVRQHEELITD